MLEAYLDSRVVDGDPFLSLELQRYLPILADFDPDFAVRFLDVAYIQRILVTAYGISSEDRAERMKLTGKRFFWHACLNTGMGFVMQTLTNNHFFYIRQLLKSPYLHGCWKGFMPAHIFAVLYHKKAILGELAMAKQGGVA